MEAMKQYVLALALFVLILSPISANASTLTNVQVSAIISLLTAFGVDASIVENVRIALTPRPLPATGTVTSPAFVIPTTPESVPSGPSRLSLQGPTEVLGAMCQPARFRISVLEQSGIEMLGQEVVMLAPHDTQTLKTVSENTGDGVRTYATFFYNTPATSTTESITFSSGGLSTSAVLNVRNGVYGRMLPIDGFRVDEHTRLCY